MFSATSCRTIQSKLKLLHRATRTTDEDVGRSKGTFSGNALSKNSMPGWAICEITVRSFVELAWRRNTMRKYLAAISLASLPAIRDTVVATSGETPHKESY